MRALSLLLRRLFGKQTKLTCITSIGCNNYADYIAHYRGVDGRHRRVYCCSPCKKMILENNKYINSLRIQSMANGEFIPLQKPE